MAGRYGLTPDPWQTDVLRDWMRVSDGRWAAPRCGLAVPRQNGKNALLEMRELYGMVVLGERFLHTAHEVKTARKAFQRLLEFFDSHAFPELKDLVVEIRKANGQEKILLSTGGSVEFVARSSGSGRGFSVDVLVCDEAQAQTEAELEALLPTISASPNPQVIFTGTPPKPEREKGGVFRRMRQAGVLGEDERLAWSEWSCPDDLSGVDLDAPNEWVERNPGCPVRLRVTTIADEREQFSDEAFARERLGWWESGAGAGGAINPEVWSSLHTAAPDRAAASFALDVAPDHSQATIAAGWKTPDGSWLQLADHRPGVDWVPGRWAELRAAWGGRLVVESGGTAAFLIPRLTDVHEVTRRFYVDACATLDAAVTSRQVRHSGEAVLSAAVGAARWSTSGEAGARVLSRKDGRVSPLVAAALVLHSLSVSVKKPSRVVFV